MLDLFAALVLDKFENSKHRDLSSRSPSRLPETASKGIQSVLVEIDTVAQNVFGGYLSRSSSSRLVSRQSSSSHITDRVQG